MMNEAAKFKMFDEIAVGLKEDAEVFWWLQDQLKDVGASDDSVMLAMGVISSLIERDMRIGTLH